MNVIPNFVIIKKFYLQVRVVRCRNGLKEGLEAFLAVFIDFVSFLPYRSFVSLVALKIIYAVV